MKIQVRLILLPFIFIALLWCCKFAYSQDEGLSIIVVKSRNIRPYNSVAASFKEMTLKRQNDIKIIELDFESEGGNAAQLSNKIASIKPALIITLGAPATVGLRGVSGLPTIIYTMILNPLRNDIAPPGVSMDIPFEINLRGVKRILPNIKRIGTIYSAGQSRDYEELGKVGAKLGLQLIGKQIDSQKDFPSALDEVFKNIDCFVMLADPNIYLPKTTEYLLLQGLQRKVPVVGLSSSYTKAGALLAFDCDYEDLGKQTAELAFRILNNEAQALQENVLPRKINFSLNLLVARRIDIEVPQKVMKEASEVFGK